MESISNKKPLVKYWLHTGFLKINKEKMSKSLKNFKTIKNALQEYPAEVIRYFFISFNYRQPADFSDEVLNNSQNAYKRLKNIVSELKDDKKVNEKYLKEFEKAMDDDFNTPNALQVLWKLVRDEKAIGKFQTIKKIDEIFGLRLFEKDEIKVPMEILKLIDERNLARKNKDWNRADELRNMIKDKGYVMDDTGDGTKIKKA